MEITDKRIKTTIISQIPHIELFDEKIIHKKVHYNKFKYIRFIPKGVKGILYFKKHQSKCYCYFIELLQTRKTKQKNTLYINFKDYKNRIAVDKVYQYICSFDEYLCCGRGTLLYGTLCRHNNMTFKSNNNYFVCESILYSKGNKYTFNKWDKMFYHIYELIQKSINNTPFTKNSILITTPITKELPTNIKAITTELNYDIYCFHFINTNYKSIYSKKHTQSQKVHLYVKANIKSDIYELYDCNNKKVGITHIPDYKTSVMMNGVFRKIKENNNLDYLEESDDEDEFENISTDKFVDLDKKEVFTCVYNNKFNMWIPVEHIIDYSSNQNKYPIYKIKSNE